ncbi:MAG: lignostilbene-alpha,beta-dioxygenase [Phormidesmis sp. RL_2_1]|nr:lignostilbene-alpha,beta-dioxygenase [Phormidesmis sp. RL_2_1]
MSTPTSLSYVAYSSPLPPNSVVWGKQGESKALKQAQQTAWAAAFRSQLQEFDYEITDIEGTLPDGLKGSTLFRNGPSRFERGAQRVAHYLDGDGYLAKIAFAPNGKVYFTSRFISTAEHQKEAHANAFCFRTTFGNNKSGAPLTTWLDLYLKNPANTHILPWGNKLLALYEAGMPYRIEPTTLDTLGIEDLGGNLQSRSLPFDGPALWLAAIYWRSQGQQASTAHPHVDPERDRLVMWHWGMDISPGQPNALTIQLSEYNSDWQTVSSTHYKMPGAAVNPHDFALTPNYYIFFENALSFDVFPYLMGQKSPAECLKLLPKPTKVHLIPRPDGDMAKAKPLVMETEQWFSIHQACASEKTDGSVEIYSSGWPATTGGFLTSWGGYAPDFDAIAPTFLWQTTIHPTAKTITHQIALGTQNNCIAHPHTHPDYETLPSRYLYMAYCNNIGQSSPPVGYLRLDTHRQTQQLWTTHPQSFVEEPVIVPHPQGKKEDDGWLLGLIYDHLQKRSSLAIFDLANLAGGPICRLWFTHHLAHGLHGSWISKYYGPTASPLSL